nr:glutathione S-transferase [Bougainvillea spectabilis]
MADLKIYADRKSQPSRAILIFCKVNGIEFEEVNMDIFKGEHKSPEYEAINPMKKVPAIAHGNFTLFESHAILIYLACSYKVAEHWYPTDLRTRAKLHSVLDWHHTNLRAASVGYLINTVIGPKLGLEHSPKGVAEMEQKLSASFSTIDTFWLKGDDDNVKFLLGTDQPTIADLSLVCEIMALHMVPEEDYNRLISPYKKVVQWIENVKKATNPHFDEVHQHLFEVIAS